MVPDPSHCSKLLAYRVKEQSLVRVGWFRASAVFQVVFLAVTLWSTKVHLGDNFRFLNLVLRLVKSNSCDTEVSNTVFSTLKCVMNTELLLLFGSKGTAGQFSFMNKAKSVVCKQCNGLPGCWRSQRILSFAVLHATACISGPPCIRDARQFYKAGGVAETWCVGSNVSVFFLFTPITLCGRFPMYPCMSVRCCHCVWMCWICLVSISMAQ